MFGNNNTTNTFGTFGQKPATTFGAASTPAFGAAAPATNPVFGQSSATGNVFGSANTSFGAAKPANAFSFGSTTPAATTQGSVFGQPAANTSLFGSSSTLGTSSVFGAAKPIVTSGSQVKYDPVNEIETVKKGVNETKVTMKHMSISAMPAYNGKSVEMLRYEDYAENRKGPQNGATAQTTGGVFGSATPAAAPSATTGAFSFGTKPQATLFGATAAPATTSLFGTSPATPAAKSTFGFGVTAATPTATTPSLFGQPAAATKSLFGQPASTPPAATTSLFGGGATTGFGSAATATATPSAFGSTATAQPTNLFGATAAASSTPSLFGSTAAAPATSLFGAAKPASTAFSFGTSTATTATSLFGSTAAAKPATGNLFGTSATTSTPSLFGSTPSTGLFGAKPAALPTATTSLFAAKPAATTTFGFGATPSLGLGGLAAQPTVAAAAVPAQTLDPSIQGFISTVKNSPYGDSQLFCNLIPDEKRTEEMKKPTNPEAQRDIINNAQSNYSVKPVTKLRPKALITAIGMKKVSMFNSLDNDDSSYSMSHSQNYSPSASKGILNLKKNSTPNRDNISCLLTGKSGGRGGVLDTPPLAPGSAHLNGSSSISTSADSRNRHLNLLSPRVSSVAAQKLRADLSNVSSHGSGLFNSSSMSQPGSPAIGGSFRSHTAAANSSSGASASSMLAPSGLSINHANSDGDTSKELDKTLETTLDLMNMPVDKRIGRALPLNESLSTADRQGRPTMARVDDELLPEDNGDNIAVIEGSVAGVTCSRAGYYIEPTLEQLDEMFDPQDGSCVISNLIIGCEGLGNILFFGETDVAGMNIDEIVFFRSKEVTVYPNSQLSPPVGQGLNKHAQVTLDGIFPKDPLNQDQTIQCPEDLKLMKFEQKLKNACRRNGSTYKDYLYDSGSWVFEVQHFSKYGFDSDDEYDSDDDIKKLEKENGLAAKNVKNKVQLDKNGKPIAINLSSAAARTPLASRLASDHLRLSSCATPPPSSPLPPAYLSPAPATPQHHQLLSSVQGDGAHFPSQGHLLPHHHFEDNSNANCNNSMMANQQTTTTAANSLYDVDTVDNVSNFTENSLYSIDSSMTYNNNNTTMSHDQSSLRKQIQRSLFQNSINDFDREDSMYDMNSRHNTPTNPKSMPKYVQSPNRGNQMIYDDSHLRTEHNELLSDDLDIAMLQTREKIAKLDDNNACDSLKISFEMESLYTEPRSTCFHETDDSDIMKIDTSRQLKQASLHQSWSYGQSNVFKRLSDNRKFRCSFSAPVWNIAHLGEPIKSVIYNYDVTNTSLFSNLPGKPIQNGTVLIENIMSSGLPDYCNADLKSMEACLEISLRCSETYGEEEETAMDMDSQTSLASSVDEFSTSTASRRRGGRGEGGGARGGATTDAYACPRIQPVASDESLHLYAEHFSDQCQDNPDASDLLHYSNQVWRLMTALWGNIGQYLVGLGEIDVESYAYQLARHASINDWLLYTIKARVDSQLLDFKPNSLKRVYLELSSMRFTDACKTACEAGYFRLNSMLACGGTPDNQHLFTIQLSDWKNNDALEYINSDLQKIYSLLAGIMSLDTGSHQINTCEDLHWIHCLALHLWFSNGCVSLSDAMKAYDVSYNSPSGVQNNYARPPQPHYLHQDSEYNKDKSDLTYMLLKLSIDQTQPLVNIITTRTYTDNALDHHLGWHVAQALHSVGYRSLPDCTMNRLHLNYASQLETLKLWKWAVYVLCHLSEHSLREKHIRELLNRNVTLECTQDDKDCNFLMNKLNIPSTWISYAKALKAKVQGQIRDQCLYLIDAEEYITCHRVFLESIAPQAFNNDNFEDLLQVLDELKDNDNQIPDWKYGAGIYCEYFYYFDKPIPNMNKLESEGLVERASEMIQNITSMKRPTYLHTSAMETIVEKVHSVVKSKANCDIAVYS